MQASRSLLLLLVLSSLLFACGSDKEAWWEKSDACPEGATIDRDGRDVFCANEGVRHGRFASYAEGGERELLSGAYKSGKRDGTWTQSNLAGEVLGTFQLVEGTGTVYVWREDGSVETQAQHEGDVRSGTWARYHDAAGQTIKLEEGQHTSGKADGKWTFRDHTGRTTREIDYRAGEVWETRLFEAGELATTQLSAAAQAEADKRAKELAKQAHDSGILGALLAQQGGAFAALTGTADFSSGLDDKDVYGGILGDAIGDMKGGFGVSGVGPGGGGTGWGTIGTGKYGTIGKGSGTGSGYGTGSGRLGRRSTPPRIRMGATTATGSLDKNIIRRYIRRKVPAIRNCYAKELRVKPKLQGSVTMQLTIGPSGAVVNATVRGLGNKKVESCIARTARQIRFPKPKGGNNVIVRMPFVFRPGEPAKPAAKTPAPAKKPVLKGGGAVKRRQD